MKRSIYSTFTVGDPRRFDGDPFEVVQRSVAQTKAVAEILTQCLADANKMARNAEMERALQRGEDPDAAGWEDNVQAQLFAQLSAQAETIQKKLETLERAASFNPRRPPKA